MKFLKIKTRPMLPPKDDIYNLFQTSLPRLHEGDVLLITSKILAIHQGRTVKIDSRINKRRLIKSEAEKYSRPIRIGQSEIVLTIKDHTLIPSAGIDESNGNGYYILWPKDVNRLLKQIWRDLRERYKIKKLGIIATDSHTVPLRWGVLGISIGFYGLEPVADRRGQKDIFGRRLRFTKSNIVDTLAAMGVLVMGEAGESTPMLIIRGADFVKFSRKSTYRTLVISKNQKDLYHKVLKRFSKKKQPRAK